MHVLLLFHIGGALPADVRNLSELEVSLESCQESRWEKFSCVCISGAFVSYVRLLQICSLCRRILSGTSTHYFGIIVEEIYKIDPLFHSGVECTL